MSVADGSERRSTKQESAWFFRIWYSFDHKYPFPSACCVASVLLFVSVRELIYIFSSGSRGSPTFRFEGNKGCNMKRVQFHALGVKDVNKQL